MKMANNTDLSKNFSIALNYYKTIRKKSVKEIADALCLPASTVSSWNTGRHLPDMERLQRLSEYLDAPLEQFFEFSLDNIPDKDLMNIHNKIDTDNSLVQFLKLFLQLSEDDRHLVTLLTYKILKQ
jgi:transcriptional regulator with XRE-family HTH domain